jgi:hypothetical protein
MWTVRGRNWGCTVGEGELEPAGMGIESDVEGWLEGQCLGRWSISCWSFWRETTSRMEAIRRREGLKWITMD